jgi:hypothetical protein
VDEYPHKFMNKLGERRTDHGGSWLIKRLN